MKKQKNKSARASAFQITFATVLIFAFAILPAATAWGSTKQAVGQSQSVFNLLATPATPTLGNYPETSLLLSTDMTVAPDAAPTNTASINVSTSTDFNGTLEGDPATGVVRVTDAHPAGAYTVTVTAFDTAGVTAAKTFTLIVTTPITCLPVIFGTTTVSNVGGSPQSVALGDFNGDGKQDLVVAHELSDNVSILLGDGAGNFGAPTNFSVGDSPESVALGDFNGDGKQDFAVANRFSDDVSILLGDGTGNFSVPTNFAVGGSPYSVTVGDFNGDGRQDLAVPNINLKNVSILLGHGTGNFSAPTDFHTGGFPYSVAVGDFNDDGKQDLAVPYTGFDPDYNGGVAILLGDGTGNFSGPTLLSAGNDDHSVAVGDFNGDGKQDLAVTYALPINNGGVFVFLGNGDGSFSAARNFRLRTSSFFVEVGDFNGDSKQDLAIVNSVSLAGTLSILLGDGTGNFRPPVNLTVGAFAQAVAVGDFNGDARQDLAVANRNSGNLSIFLRECPVTQITRTGTSCSEFSSGSFETVDSVEYAVNNDLIDAVAPHELLYWVKVMVPAGNNIFRVTQTITTGNFNTFLEGDSHGSDVFDSSCVTLERTIKQSGNTVTVRFNAPAADTYFIAIKFNAQSLIGKTAPSPETTVHYDFSTTDVPDSTSGLDLVTH
jgi:hypothetical protein